VGGPVFFDFGGAAFLPLFGVTFPFFLTGVSFSSLSEFISKVDSFSVLCSDITNADGSLDDPPNESSTDNSVSDFAFSTIFAFFGVTFFSF
jgi:hypothetical protein